MQTDTIGDRQRIRLFDSDILACLEVVVVQQVGIIGRSEVPHSHLPHLSTRFQSLESSPFEAAVTLLLQPRIFCCVTSLFLAVPDLLAKELLVELTNLTSAGEDLGPLIRPQSQMGLPNVVVARLLILLILSLEQVLILHLFLGLQRRHLT